MDHLWKKHPAFMSGIPLLLGTACALCFDPLYFFLLALWVVPLYRRKKTLAAACAIFAIALLITSWRCPLQPLPHERCTGKGIFTPSNLKNQHTPFYRALLYQGRLDFTTDRGERFTALPCTISLPLFSKHPSAHCSYEIEGDLLQKAERSYQLKPLKKKAWIPVESPYRFAQWRYRAKQAFSQSLKKQIADRHTHNFLNALATGEIEDRILSLEFGKLGLQHILSISGFHFALIALFFGFLLRLFFPYRTATALLLLLLSSYAFFLGGSPSVLRSWIALSVFLTGLLLNRRTSALNALGVGLWGELLIDPLYVSHLGFQLSFLCTLSLLLLTPLCMHWISRLLPIRSREEVKEMSRLDQHGYLFASYLRSAFSVNLAVLIASLPVLLYHFHRFPWLSLAYNLFFPLFVSLSLFLLCLSTLIGLLLPPLGSLLHQFNGMWTSTFLTLTTEPPAYCDLVLRIKEIPSFLVALYLTALFTYALLWQEKQRHTLFQTPK